MTDVQPIPPITTEANSAINQSEFLTCSKLGESRAYKLVLLLIGRKNWREILKPNH